MKQKQAEFVPKYFRADGGFSLTKIGGFHIIYEDMMRRERHFKPESKNAGKGSAPAGSLQYASPTGGEAKQGKEELP